MIDKIKSTFNDEMDLLEASLTIWKNKLKIFYISISAVILMLSFQMLKVYEPKYISTAEIKPISTFDQINFNTYNLYLNNIWANQLSDTYKETSIMSVSDKDGLNSIKSMKKQGASEYYKIDKKYLVQLFVEKLQENILIKKEIKKFNLVKKENFNNQQEYEDAVTKLASSIKFLSPSSDIKDVPFQANWRIQFITKDKEMWKNFLNNLNKPANEQVRIFLKKNHDKLVKNLKQLKEFNLEDIEMKMENAVINYKIITKRKLSYLNEQAKIARKLNLAKNNYVEPQNIYTKNAVLTNVISNFPDYIKGYEMIEKEIELIEKRENIKAFVPNFPKLEKEKRKISSNKSLERLDALFEGTPIYNSENFRAGQIMYQATEHQIINDRNLIRMLILSFVIGTIIAIFYVLMENAIQNRK